MVRLVGDTSAGPNTDVYTVYPTTKNTDIQRVWTTTTTGKRHFSDVSFLTSFKKKKNYWTFSPDLNNNRSVTRPPPVATPSLHIRPSSSSCSSAWRRNRVLFSKIFHESFPYTGDAVVAASTRSVHVHVVVTAAAAYDDPKPAPPYT